MTDLQKQYYSVTCKCGHADSRNQFIKIEFGVVATSGKEAAAKARWFPRCKHHQKDCILEVKKLTYEDYRKLIKQNNEDPYLKCHTIQEQRMYDLSDRFIREPDADEYYKEKETSTYMHGKKNIRHPKSYMKNVLRAKEAYSY